MSTDKQLVTPIKSKRLGEQIAEQLAASIAAGEYAIGSRLPAEREFAESFKVGRPTVREALLILERDGLVEIKTGSGVYVVSLQAKRARALESSISMLELIEARCMFEGESAALAAKLATREQIEAIRQALAAMMEEDRLNIPGELADREFHVQIARATQNAAIVYVIEALWDARSGSAQVAQSLTQVRAAGIKPRIDEHTAVFDAIEAREPERARAAMRAHLMRVIDDLIKAAEAKELSAMQVRIDEQRKRYLGDLQRFEPTQDSSMPSISKPKQKPKPSRPGPK